MSKGTQKAGKKTLAVEMALAVAKSAAPFEWFLCYLHFVVGNSFAEAHRIALRQWQGNSSEAMSLRKARELMKSIDPDLINLAKGGQDDVSSIVRILKRFLDNPQAPVPFLISHEARKVATLQIADSMRKRRLGSGKTANAKTEGEGK